MLEAIFWILISLVIYTYLGYGLLLLLLVKMLRRRTSDNFQTDLPTVVHLIAAYNEKDFIERKIINSLEMEYPTDKYQVWVVTDGSDDGTDEIVKRFPNVRLFHQKERKGKIHAVNRVMPNIQAEVTVFSDANTMVNNKAIQLLVQHYHNPKIGGVSGEKRILVEEKDDATSSGEGIYWKYESFLKKYDFKLYSVVGAAGELFSIRTALYESIPSDTLIEDFYLTLFIAKKGYIIGYEPDAYALEESSTNVREEAKRKIRISAGGLQAIWRLRALFNIFKYRWLSFQFISHRVLRWTLTPLALPFLLLINVMLFGGNDPLYGSLLVCQSVFYLFAAIGWMLQYTKVKVKAFFIPFYFVFMNISVYLGLVKLLAGKQSVVWERASRKDQSLIRD